MPRFTFCVTLGSSLFIGLLPAWCSTKTAPVEVLRTSSATAGGKDLDALLRAGEEMANRN